MVFKDVVHAWQATWQVASGSAAVLSPLSAPDSNLEVVNAVNGGVGNIITGRRFSNKKSSGHESFSGSRGQKITSATPAPRCHCRGREESEKS